jgi:hypothetical protein
VECGAGRRPVFRLTGLGYSLVYPGFGVEAVRRAPPKSAGLASGAYTAFLDIALGIAISALGLIADLAGLGTVFLPQWPRLAGAWPFAYGF